MDDMRAVMDAAGSERAALVGVSEGGPLSMLFAATLPGAHDALVLVGAEVEGGNDRRLALGRVDPRRARGVHRRPSPSDWGKGRRLRALLPKHDRDPEGMKAWFGKLQTAAMTPPGRDGFMAWRSRSTSATSLPAIRVPTLIVHRVDDHVCHVENARYLADEHPRRALRRAARRRPLPWAEAPRRRHPRRDPRSSSPASARRPSPTASSRPSSSPTSSARPSGRPSSATGAGAELLESHHATSGASSSASAAARSTPPATGSSPRFDGPARAIRCARAVGRRGARRSGSRSAPASTPASASSSATSSPASPCTSARGSPRRPAPARSWSRARCTTSSPAPGSSSRDRGSTELKGVPGEWRLYAVQRLRLLSSRSMRRLLSRSAMSRRLSRPSLPRATASSTFAFPSLK